MVKLTVVPNTPKTNKSRTKRRVRPDGPLQCNRCSGQVSVTLVTGAFVKNGRKQGGTVIYKDVCYTCLLQGVFFPMLPELKPVKR